MKKFFIAVSLIVTLAGGYVHAQSAPIDLVVLVDTSESMLPYWKDTTNYLIKNILTGVLHKGDTFHLISFASRPELEISKTIESEKDIQAILARFLLLQPLGRYTDLVAAIQYLYQYTVDLPLATQKKIIILTDGIHDPPPDSRFPIKYGPSGRDISGNRQLIIETAQAMRRHGWEIHIVQYPQAGAAAPGTVIPQPGVQLLGSGGGQFAGRAAPVGGQSSGRPIAGGRIVGRAGGSAHGGVPRRGGEKGLLKDLSRTLGVRIQQFEGGNKKNLANIATGSPSIVFPKNLGNVGYDATAPFVIRNFQDQAIFVRLSGIIYDGINILRRPVNRPIGAKQEATLKAPLRLPVSLTLGPHTLDVELRFADSLRVSPHSGRLSFTLAKGIIEAQGIGLYVLPVLIGIVLIAVVILMVIFIRRIVGNLGVAPPASSTPRIRLDGSGIYPIELRVTGQNPNIGGRNIHPMGAGAHRTVGGGGSAFLIYLYPCPAHIGEIVCDGESYTFSPTKAEFFPDLKGDVRNCLGKEIRVLPDEHHDVTFTFRRYVSPLAEVNRIMHLVDKPGVAPGDGPT